MQKEIYTPMQPENVAEKFNIGNTKIIICDDAYRDRTSFEKQGTLDSIADIWSREVKDKCGGENNKNK